MGKVVGIFAGEITGSVGKVTFRRTNGENIVAQKMTQITNPRTEGQQVQRMKMYTCMKAYSYLKEICDHSFEGFSGKIQNMSRFMKLNLRMLTTDLSLNTADDFDGSNCYLRKGVNNEMAQNDYIISDGSLRSNVFVKTDDAWQEGETDVTRINLLADNNTGKFVTQPDLQNITVADFHKLIGCEIGTQMTLVNIFSAKDPAMMLTRYVFKKESANAKVFKLQDEDYIVDSTNLDEGSTNIGVGAQMVCITNKKRADSKYYIALDVPTISTDPASASAFILSKKENGKWLRSSSTLTWQAVEKDVKYLPYFALNSWNVGTNRYLNNATV